jgi:hypothetical protein
MVGLLMSNQTKNTREQSNCKHNWHFVQTFIGAGEPRLMEQLEPVPIGSDEMPKIRSWVDCRQEYAKYLCDKCGTKKQVATAHTAFNKIGDKS